METDVVCFPAPLNACFLFSYGPTIPRAASIHEHDSLEALRELASADCYLCKLDELFGEDWD